MSELMKLINNADKLHEFMRIKLEENKHKTLGAHPDDRRGMTITGLKDRVLEEWEEMTQAMWDAKSPEDVWREAGDVANFIMMLAMKYEEIHTHKKGGAS